MKIHCYTLCYNEEVILPFYIDHYKQFCDRITILNNLSTDRSKEIALDKGCKVIDWGSNDTFNDLMHMKLKHSIYKDSQGVADWVIVSDCDELLYHPNMKELLAGYDSSGINLPKIDGFDMVSETLPKEGIQITEQIKLGVPAAHLGKRIIFKPNLEMKWTIGCHPTQDWIQQNIPYARESRQADIKLLHYKLLNNEYVKKRYEMYRKRLSLDNMRYQLGTHYLQSDKELDDQFFNYYLKNRVQVI